VLADVLLLHHRHSPLAHTHGHQLHAVSDQREADDAVLVLGLNLLGVLAGQLGSAQGLAGCARAGFGGCEV
jgi:hypothetical protein